MFGTFLITLQIALQDESEIFCQQVLRNHPVINVVEQKKKKNLYKCKNKLAN